MLKIGDPVTCVGMSKKRYAEVVGIENGWVYAEDTQSDGMLSVCYHGPIDEFKKLEEKEVFLRILQNTRQSISE